LVLSLAGYACNPLALAASSPSSRATRSPSEGVRTFDREYVVVLTLDERDTRAKPAQNLATWLRPSPSFASAQPTNSGTRDATQYGELDLRDMLDLIARKIRSSMDRTALRRALSWDYSETEHDTTRTERRGGHTDLPDGLGSRHDAWAGSQPRGLTKPPAHAGASCAHVHPLSKSGAYGAWPHPADQPR